MGGAWVLGCSLCAAALARRQVPCGTAGTQKQKNAGGSRTGRSNCTWARYEARPSFLQAEYVKQHACSDCHKLGEQAFLMPDEPVRLSLQRDGVVPQLQDWVRVWRWSREGDSWASAERHSHTENWIDQLIAWAAVCPITHPRASAPPRGTCSSSSVVAVG